MKLPIGQMMTPIKPNIWEKKYVCYERGVKHAVFRTEHEAKVWCSLGTYRRYRKAGQGKLIQ